ncbi:hypothetical protein [Lentzea terrae]|uniref:hypothetical protein n=1 Tax=Lentzea terrae TaxID=2200761 RepID=UPI000DD40337|nr:hypothetical protein [Lentzea terrae]
MFGLRSYGAGHSELRMFARTGPEHRIGVMLLFEGTGMIKLSTRSYPDAVLRLAGDHEIDEFRELEWRHELWLALESPSRTGYISCGRVSAREVNLTDRRVEANGRLLMSLNYETHRSTLPAPARQPPRELDGAQVDQFALVGPLQRPRGTSPATAFAVTRDGDTWRLLHCDDDWNILGSSTHEGAYRAMRQAATEFEALEFLEMAR